MPPLDMMVDVEHCGGWDGIWRKTFQRPRSGGKGIKDDFRPPGRGVATSRRGFNFCLGALGRNL